MVKKSKVLLWPIMLDIQLLFFVYSAHPAILYLLVDKGLFLLVHLGLLLEGSSQDFFAKRLYCLKIQEEPLAL